MKNIFVHRLDLENPGDLNSTPFHYLDNSQRGFLIDYTALQNLSGWDFDNVIVGGGGMANKFVSSLNNFLQNQNIKNLVIWGAGWELNNPQLDQLAERTQLLGIREWLPDTVYKHNWVPCVSVLHPCIEKSLSIQPSKNFLIIDHWKRQPIEIEHLRYSRISNKPNSIENVVEAIADHRWVITSSYHGAYWGILLGKRVIFVSDPWIAKCETLKYKIPRAEKFGLELLDQTEKHLGAYEECRNTNLEFKKKFQDLWI